jgi:hypothetical protein
MNLEKRREQLSRRLRQMRAGAVLDERQIGLADGLSELGAHGARDLALRHFPAEPSEVPFETAQHAEFLAEGHFN